MTNYTRSLLLMTVLCGMVMCDNWKLVWSDEFDGGDIYEEKWSFDIGNNNGWGNNEWEYYTRENHEVSGGSLKIHARKEEKEGFHYTSTKIHSSGKFNLVYGMVEVRAKLPFGQGIWPAFWMLGENIHQVGWPACGEIDIMEFIGKNPNTVYGSIHGQGLDSTSQCNVPNPTEYHTYAVNWYPGVVEYYIDGNLYGKDTQ